MASTTRTATLAFAGCDATTTPQTWTVDATNTCSGGSLAASGHGDMISLDNTAASLNGSATFTCNRGTWEVDSTTATCAPVGGASVSNSAILQGENIIIDVAHTRPADVEITVKDSDGTEVEGVTFTPPSVTGTGPTSPVTVTIPGTAVGDNYDITVTLKNPSPDGSIISISDPISISVRPISGCGDITPTWGSSSQCTGTLTASNHGVSSGISNTASGFTGSAAFTCNDGTWEVDASATCTNEVFDEFGISVATDGTRTIVGGNEGVHIYETINANGTLGGRVLLNKTSDIDSGSRFGSSAAIDGDYTIVGAPFDDNDRGESAGSAYIYKRDNNILGPNKWGNPIFLILPTGIETTSSFGSSVAIDGNYAIVGANRDHNALGNDAGSAYIYERNTATGIWSNPITLRLPTDLEEDSFFGDSVSIDGNYAIVGASHDDNDIDGDGTPDADVGSAYIYERNTATGIWGNPTALTLPTLDSDGSDDTGLDLGSNFGSSVAIDGNYAIVGASFDDNELGMQVGSAYIYERVESRTGPNKWGNPISLTLPTGLESASSFGSSVSIDGNYAIVGARVDSSDVDEDGIVDSFAGNAYIYERDSATGWVFAVHLRLPTLYDDDGSDDTGLESGSVFGSSVSIDGNYAIVGAWGDDNVLGTNAGSVYTYERAVQEIGIYWRQQQGQQLWHL